MSTLETALKRVETLERLLKDESKRRQIAESTLRERGGAAYIAECKAKYYQAKIIHGHDEKWARAQEKMDRQRREIVRLTQRLAEQGVHE